MYLQLNSTVHNVISMPTQKIHFHFIISSIPFSISIVSHLIISYLIKSTFNYFLGWMELARGNSGGHKCDLLHSMSNLEFPSFQHFHLIYTYFLAVSFVRFLTECEIDICDSNRSNPSKPAWKKKFKIDKSINLPTYRAWKKNIIMMLHNDPQLTSCYYYYFFC